MPSSMLICTSQMFWDLKYLSYTIARYQPAIGLTIADRKYAQSCAG